MTLQDEEEAMANMTLQDEEEAMAQPPLKVSPNVAALQQKRSNNLPPVVHRLEAGIKLPVCVIVVGMAGSGKTTLLTKLQRHLEEKYDKEQEENDENDKNDNDDDDDDDDDFMPAYCVNLDPATLGETAYEASIDIRDTINYKQVMEQHQLGPNGAIMTSLNLFATKFDQVLEILDRRAVPGEAEAAAAAAAAAAASTTEGESSSLPPPFPNKKKNKKTMDYILVDTPGQIEAFTWSASGQIISEALASSFPTCLCFVVDTARCASSPNTFMSNMLYACSMIYRTRLPLVICFNKTDVVSHEFCMDWMRDYESFQQALDDHSANAGFYGSLTRSLSLVLDEFYSNFANAVGVSAVTGDGMDDFWKTVQTAATKDFPDYVADLKLRVEEQEAKQHAIAKSQVRRLQRDINESK